MCGTTYTPDRLGVCRNCHGPIANTGNWNGHCLSLPSTVRAHRLTTKFRVLLFVVLRTRYTMVLREDQVWTKFGPLASSPTPIEYHHSVDPPVLEPIVTQPRHGSHLATPVSAQGSLFTLTAAAATAYAAIVGRQANVPACAQSCVESGLSTSSCDPSDDACLCADSTFVNNVSSCVASSCSTSDAQAAAAAFDSICSSAVGVPLP
ncbi:hypothetical protein F5I97DRAFT_975126 [Phlebopus sp. FC_14]|nr:hypothetical protein F5I97DRAFT_975126 [Phlebopus sp. FC_14]